ncbi:Suppressor of tumorigenicity 14 protein [Mactra antiquata]
MKMKSFTFICFLLIFVWTEYVACFQKDYLNKVCNTAVNIDTSRGLESSTALYYSANTACYYSITVGTGKRVMILVRIFELEAEVFNSCVDFVNFHDGPSTGSSTLNPAPLCDKNAVANYTSTGNQLTIYFETDSTGARHGFDFIIVAITSAPCNTGQFTCNNNICIDSSLHCNRYDECGDNSDEAGCDYTHLTGTQPNDNAPLIIGLSIGIPLLIVCCVLIGFWCWKDQRWRVFMKRPLKAKQFENENITYEATYPITHIYYKHRFQSLYKDSGQQSNYSRSDVSFSEQGSTSTRKPENDVTSAVQG